ncbi:MAG: hypothetical protein J3Q66DRAFT_423414 [Benniella sp.]|nr:MAG: hypothetical protein J3Q66DRAFT_423414 [Benniella sp.]
MVFNSAASASSDALSLKQPLELVNLRLANPRGTKDFELALELSGDADATLYRIKGPHLLQSSHSSDIVLEPIARNWIQDVENDPDEQERLKALATDVVKQLLSGIDHCDLLDVYQLQGLADLICGADSGCLDSDDPVKILELLSARLTNTHLQPTTYVYQLTLAISYVLDAMVTTKVNELDLERLHTPLSSYLDKLKGGSDPYLVYQAACARLQYVPDSDTLRQKTMRLTGTVIQGLSGLVSAVKGLDWNGFIKGLRNIQQGMAGVTDVY